MKSKYKIIVSILMFIGFLFIFPVTFNAITIAKESNVLSRDIKFNLKSSANSDKIYINNNWTETKMAGICMGSGTASDPYLIEDLVIDAGGIGHGIYINNTVEHFEIKNCTLYNSGLNFNDAGIKLNLAQNGVLVNNTMFNNSYGMSIYTSKNLKIIKNRFYGAYAIELLYTNDSILYLNTFKTDVVAVFFYYSYNQYNSLEKFTYSYEGRIFTNNLGNYWSEYTRLDQNNDGIGDAAVHVISHFHNATLTDNYPLMEPIHNYVLNVSEGIPGYNLLFLTSIFGLCLLVIIRKSKKSLNPN